MGDEINILSDCSNAVVARAPGRKYPGVLLQGDSLSSILGEVDELMDRLGEGDFESARGGAQVVREWLSGVLEHYESVLDREGIPLPYKERVGRGPGRIVP